jgi:hypothetical protein
MTMTEIPPSIILNDDTSRARRKDPLTSHEAADSNDIHASIGLVLATLTALGPLADHQVVEILADEPYTPQRIRTARAALVKRGLVEKAGFKRRTKHNFNAEVWKVVEA